MTETARTQRVQLSRPRAPYSIYRRTKKIGERVVLLRNWWVRFRADGPQGRKRHFINLRTEDRAEAELKAAQLVIRMNTAPASTSSDPVLSEILAEYRRHLKATKAKKTSSNRWYVLKAFFGETFQDWKVVKLSRVSTNLISRYIDRMRLEKDVRPWTVYEVRKALLALFNYAIKQHGFASNPARDVEPPTVAGRPIDYLKRDEIPTVLSALNGDAPCLYAPVATAIFAGLRRSEIMWLTWEDLDLTKGVISVRFKAVGGEHYSPKTNRSRVVPVSKELAPILAALPSKAQWVFPSPEGMRWWPNNLGNRLRRAMRAKGWRHAFLTFRHTFGSQLAQKGMSLYKISKLMGNSEEVCREHYAALAPYEMHEEVSFL